MPNEEEDGPLDAFWDQVRLKSEPSSDTPTPTSESLGFPPGSLIIGTLGRPLVIIHPDGSLIYGPDYTPEEAAVTFWEEMGRRRLQMEERLLLIHHMDAVLTRLGVTDLHNQAATERLQGRISDDNLRAAQAAQRALERAVHNAIELGRGMARRPDMIQTPAPTRIPEVIRNNPDSSYGQEPSDEVPEV